MRYAFGVGGALVAAGLVGCSLGLSGLVVDGDAGVGAAASEAGAEADADDATSPAPADATGVGDASGPGDASGGGGGDASDGASRQGADAGDAAPPTMPDGGCAGIICNGQCTTNTDCSGCAGATLLCHGTNECQSDCGSCPGSPIECYACDINRQNPLGTCAPQDGTAYCLNTNYAGAYAGGQGYHCGCQTAGDCPGDSQVCVALNGTAPLVCFTCGETATQGTTCKSGGLCNSQTAACN